MVAATEAATEAGTAAYGVQAISQANRFDTKSGTRIERGGGSGARNNEDEHMTRSGVVEMLPFPHSIPFASFVNFQYFSAFSSPSLS